MLTTFLDSLQTYLFSTLLYIHYGSFSHRLIMSLLSVLLVKIFLREMGVIQFYTLIISDVYLLYKVYACEPVHLITVGMLAFAEMGWILFWN